MWAIASDVSAILPQTLRSVEIKNFCLTSIYSMRGTRHLRKLNGGRHFNWKFGKWAEHFSLKPRPAWRTLPSARAHGMWTYEPRQGRKAATVVCSTSAVVTLASEFMICDLRLMIGIGKPKRA